MFPLSSFMSMMRLTALCAANDDLLNRYQYIREVVAYVTGRKIS